MVRAQKVRGNIKAYPGKRYAWSRVSGVAQTDEPAALCKLMHLELPARLLTRRRTWICLRAWKHCGLQACYSTDLRTAREHNRGTFKTCSTKVTVAIPLTTVVLVCIL